MHGDVPPRWHGAGRATDSPTPTGTPVPRAAIRATPTPTTRAVAEAAGDVVVTAPFEGQVIGVEGVTFQWTEGAGATAYDLRIVNATTQAVIFTGSLSGDGSTSTLIGIPNSGTLHLPRPRLHGRRQRRQLRQLREPQLHRQPGGAECGADDHRSRPPARSSPAASRT